MDKSMYAICLQEICQVLSEIETQNALPDSVNHLNYSRSEVEREIKETKYKIMERSRFLDNLKAAAA